VLLVAGEVAELVDEHALEVVIHSGGGPGPSHQLTPARIVTSRSTTRVETVLRRSVQRPPRQRRTVRTVLRMRSRWTPSTLLGTSEPKPMTLTPSSRPARRFVVPVTRRPQRAALRRASERKTGSVTPFGRPEELRSNEPPTRRGPSGPRRWAETGRSTWKARAAVTGRLTPSTRSAACQK
jgi:hypothetical protein